MILGIFCFDLRENISSFFYTKRLFLFLVFYLFISFQVENEIVFFFFKEKTLRWEYLKSIMFEGSGFYSFPFLFFLLLVFLLKIYLKWKPQEQKKKITKLKG